jgi:PPP family 3-phenylpropionic acid transporter
MFGGLVAGFLWDGFGSEWVFTIASLLSLIAFFVAWRWVEKNNPEDLQATGESVSSI